MTNSRLEAYAMLTHHALNEIFQSEEFGCCPKCCAPCSAIQYLDNEGILDEVVKNWDTDSDGNPIRWDWWVDGKVDRESLYRIWAKASELECHER